MNSRLSELMSGFCVVVSLCLGANLAFADEKAEEEKNKRDAFDRVIQSHDKTMILGAGNLILKQVSIRMARELLKEWGREARLSPDWKSGAKEWDEAESMLVKDAVAIAKRRFANGQGVNEVWSEYLSANFGGEEADVIANHFQTQGGKEQRELMDWYMGEMVLFTYTYTGRFEYDLKGAEEELLALQKAAQSRIPKKDNELDFSTRNPEAFQFVACSPQSKYCPGVKYAKLISIPIVGGVIRHIDQVGAQIQQQMRSKRSSVEPLMAPFRPQG